MSPAARLWVRMVAGTGVSVVLYALLEPPRPPMHVPPAVAAVGGAASGIVLFVALVRRRPSLAVRERSPLVFVGLQGCLGLWAANEEIVWRRVVLGELLGAGAAVALLASTLGFAFVHRSRPFLHLGTGAVFGACYVLTGALGASVAAHWVYNALVRAQLQSRRADAEPALT